MAPYSLISTPDVSPLPPHVCRYEAGDRLSAEQALRHPFFKLQLDPLQQGAVTDNAAAAARGTMSASKMSGSQQTLPTATNVVCNGWPAVSTTGPACGGAGGGGPATSTASFLQLPLQHPQHLAADSARAADSETNTHTINVLQQNNNTAEVAAHAADYSEAHTDTLMVAGEHAHVSESEAHTTLAAAAALMAALDSAWALST